MKTDFIYLRVIFKENNNFFDTSCWEINRIFYDKKNPNVLKAVPGKLIKNKKQQNPPKNVNWADKFKLIGQWCNSAS